MTPLLAIRGVAKQYASPVLADINLDILPGEVHALVGENGAGKSTLSRILAGITRPDAGSITLDGSPIKPADRRAAESAGIHLVMQELNLLPTLSIAENIFLDHLPHRAGWIRFRQLHQQTAQWLASLGLHDLNPAAPVATLGVGQQQLVEIASRLWRPCRLLILDEPTAALTQPEVDLLFQHIQSLQNRGAAVLYISHRLDEIRRIAQRISVLRDGRLVATHHAPTTHVDTIVRDMVGRDLPPPPRSKPRNPGAPALSVHNLHAGPRVHDVSFVLHHGEILGLAGLMGSGRTETIRAITGADPATSGAVHLHGQPLPARIRSPRDAVRLGIGLVTEDRKTQGLFPPLPVRDNLCLPSLRTFATRLGWISRTRETNAARSWIDKLRIRCSSTEQPATELSGGNQQKTLLARWLLRDGDILIVDEPTRGVDVAARFEIHQILASLADQDKAVLIVSSDLPELMALCDRILVMSQGRLAAEFKRDAWSEDRIMAAAFSGHRTDHPPQPAPP